MLNPQIMQAKITLAKAEKDYKELKLKIFRLMTEIQGIVNPYFGDNIEAVKVDELKQIVYELEKAKQSAIEKKELIKLINDDLTGI